MSARILKVRENVLKKNDEIARALRGDFANTNTLAVSLVSSPGAGKTELLKQTLAKLVDGYRVSALVGDLATENDAKRLEESGAEVRQISTGTMCHLEAHMVISSMKGWDLNDRDIVFIENVGNLVCPSSYDLGENFRAVALSVTEGEDKPLKYPTIFNTSDVAIITKTDIAEVVGCNMQLLRENIQQVRPGMKIFEVSARSGEGMEEWVAYIKEQYGILNPQMETV